MQSIASPFLGLLSNKKAQHIQSFIPKKNVLISTMCFLKKYNIKFGVPKSLENPFSFVVVLKTLNI